MKRTEWLNLSGFNGTLTQSQVGHFMPKNNQMIINQLKSEWV